MLAPRSTLRALQEITCQATINNTATLIAQPLGSGKTTVAVEAILRQYGTAGRVLVVAPMSTRMGWERIVRMQYQSTDPDLIRRIDSSATGKQAMADLEAGGAGWYLVTWEYFARQRQSYWDKLNKVLDVVILDEVQRMQNRKSKTWNHMRRLGKNAKRIAMSGTPNGNKMEGFWTTLRWLWPEDEDSNVYTTPLSFWKWVSDWLTVDEDYLGYVTVGPERFELGTMLSYYENYIRESDVIETPGVNNIDVDVPLSALQKKLYKELEKQYLVWLTTVDPNTGNRPMVVELPAVMRMRLRQITLGEPVIDEDSSVSYSVDTKSSKLDASLDIIKNSIPEDEPVLVLTHSARFARVAVQRYENAGYPSFLWAGGVSDAKRTYARAEWGKENGPKIVVAVIEAIAEGVDGLQDVCNNEIWLSESENMLMNIQARKRLDRFGQKRRVNRWRLVAPGTHDEGIISKQIERELSNNASLRGGGNV